MADRVRQDASIALTYQRLSGVEGDEVSPEIQRRANLRVVQQLGFQCMEAHHTRGGDIYEDTEKGMHSAYKRTNIPDWDALIERARSDKRVGVVVAYDMQRAFRNVRAMLDEAELLNSFGVKLIRARGGEVDIQSADGRRRAIDDANAAEYHSRKTSELLRDNYAWLREEGIMYTHKPGMGLKRSGKNAGVKWETNEEFSTIVRMCEIYSEFDVGSPTLARKMNAEKLTWVNLKGERVRVKPTTVRNAINTIEKYEKFLDQELFANVIRVRTARAGRKGNSPKTRHDPLLLRKLLVCARCGGHYTTIHNFTFKKTTGERKKWSYYVHAPNEAGCDNSKKAPSSNSLHEQFWKRIAKIEDLSVEDRNAILDRMVQPPSPAVLDTRHAREKLTTTLRNLEAAYLAEDFGPLDKARAFYRKQRAQLEREIAELPPPPKIVPARFDDRDDAAIWLDNLVETLILGESLAPEEANRLMRSLFLRITMDGAELKDIDYQPEIAGWLPPL